jgi:hypothetical protein
MNDLVLMGLIFQFTAASGAVPTRGSSVRARGMDASWYREFPRNTSIKFCCKAFVRAKINDMNLFRT